ncbi:MAG: glycosyltransferase family 2 protein [Candidatus Omnitrophota bacterium]
MSGLSCDIIIPVFNNTKMTENCFWSIAENTDVPYTLIFIDNGSDEPTKRFLKDVKACNKNVEVIRNDVNRGWIKAINQGIAVSRSPYVCIMNNDTIVRTPRWLSKLIGISDAAPDIGLVNPRFKLKKGSPARKGAGAPFIEVDFCRGYCILIKRSVIDKVGLFDESYGMGYYDDDDYSARAIRAGFRCVSADGVTVEHIGDSTFVSLYDEARRRELHEKNKALFYSRWGRRLRVVFIAVSRTGGKALSEISLFLARRQHIIYLWKAAPARVMLHINIRESSVPPFFYRTFFNGIFRLNRMKRKEKRYDIVFTDDRKMAKALSALGYNAHYVDIAEDGDSIKETVASLAGSG